MRNFKLAAAALAALLAASGMAHAGAACGDSAAGFDGFIKQFKKEAAAAGVDAKGLSALNGVQYQPGIIKKDRAQGVFSLSFMDFSKRMVSNYRIKEGANILAQNKQMFDAIQQRWGVPGEVLIAFWAFETDFGKNMGDFDTISSLATLSWDCRRPDKFREQLIGALKLYQNGDLERADMKGAWAGEIGHTQFLPKEYFETAVDFDGDGHRNLRKSIPDAMASGAALLVKHGWKANQPWLDEVKLTKDLPWDQADIAIQLPRSQWVKWGVVGVDGKLKADKFPASLLLPMGKDGPAFLAYDNFTTAYLKWNESLVYSLTAGYLANRITGDGPFNPGRAPVQSLSYDQIKQLQQVLESKGYDVGTVDGKLGKSTRDAVKQEQIKMGWPADSYPTVPFLDKLQNG
ncbi:MAG: lytic murein transglycosylase [Alphaproteobacteria bacterium]|uniref:lytic murein transglycosylase n=1 Tax=Aestuariivirga sp. TaxID=2650926 RepID=UPI003015C984|nr:lytic murein transglycosylase [Alphaproteobacteria bacterium]